ncbi:hypothetical protein LCGC14_2679550 [marine sediment metagenome]|uniref:Uncharacterized protein n=1 Tax=marine sediment metagenome TaxID=412755 RepID=A0A0F9BWF8_9ZZZZ
MTDEVILFHDVIVAVSADGAAFLISSTDERLCNFMEEGSLFEDNVEWETMPLFPTEPGVYSMTIEYQFNQGYSEGHLSPGESTWDFIPSNIKIRALTILGDE